jgi:hypothetical protein
MMMIPELSARVRFLLLLDIVIPRSWALPTTAESKALAETKATTPQTPTKRLAHSPVMLLKTYLKNPTDFTAVLLIIGGEIVQKALAQLSGSQWI